MATDPRGTLQKLLDRATTPTGDDDEEARTAAVQACHLLKRYPELVAAPSVAPGLGAPARRDTESTFHPEAERLRDWRRMLASKQLAETVAGADSLCADCGQPIKKGEAVVELKKEHIATHKACGGWWWDFSPPGYDAEYDIPF